MLLYCCLPFALCSVLYPLSTLYSLSTCFSSFGSVGNHEGTNGKHGDGPGRIGTDGYERIRTDTSYPATTPLTHVSNALSLPPPLHHRRIGIDHGAAAGVERNAQLATQRVGHELRGGRRRQVRGGRGPRDAVQRRDHAGAECAAAVHWWPRGGRGRRGRRGGVDAATPVQREEKRGRGQWWGQWWAVVFGVVEEHGVATGEWTKWRGKKWGEKWREKCGGWSNGGRYFGRTQQEVE